MFKDFLKRRNIVSGTMGHFLHFLLGSLMDNFKIATVCFPETGDKYTIVCAETSDPWLLWKYCIILSLKIDLKEHFSKQITQKNQQSQTKLLWYILFY